MITLRDISLSIFYQRQNTTNTTFFHNNFEARIRSLILIIFLVEILFDLKVPKFN